MSNREEFEKLPEIKKIIDSGLMTFCERSNQYASDDLPIKSFMIGSWFIWQEQQRKIDELQKELSRMTDKHILKCQEIESLQRELYNKNQIIDACLYSDDEENQNDH